VAVPAWSSAPILTFVDYPVDKSAARAEVDAGMGRWQWDERTRKFKTTPAHPSNDAAALTPKSNSRLPL
jgi:hypothetical protein